MPTSSFNCCTSFLADNFLPQFYIFLKLYLVHKNQQLSYMSLWVLSHTPQIVFLIGHILLLAKCICNVFLLASSSWHFSWNTTCNRYLCLHSLQQRIKLCYKKDIPLCVSLRYNYTSVGNYCKSAELISCKLGLFFNNTA